MHVYLHVPFCARRCSYCDFAIAVRRTVPSERYADLILAEWTRWRVDDRWPVPPGLATVYFGGGTPSLLDPSQLARILDRLGAEGPIQPGAEVTLEANPEDVTPDRARAWRAAGVNRVSLGAQSFNPDVLRWMHRTHSADDVPRAVEAVRAAGIPGLSLDLIYAMPPELDRDWPRDLEQALALGPEHLSLYGLTVEQHTPLGRWVDRGDTRAAPDERAAAEFLLADRELAAHGFRHYEVSNYARPGHEAVHNSAYWRRAPCLGLGPSAHGSANERRWWNLRDWPAWERAVARRESAVAGEEQLDAGAIRLEQLYLGLRTDRGVPADTVPDPVARLWEVEGWAERVAGRLRLTAEGWLRLDALVGQAAGR